MLMRFSLLFFFTTLLIMGFVASHDTTVAIIGAGASGIRAAEILRKHDVDFLVIEAETRLVLSINDAVNLSSRNNIPLHLSCFGIGCLILALF